VAGLVKKIGGRTALSLSLRSGGLVSDVPRKMKVLPRKVLMHEEYYHRIPCNHDPSSLKFYDTALSPRAQPSILSLAQSFIHSDISILKVRLFFCGSSLMRPRRLMSAPDGHRSILWYVHPTGGRRALNRLSSSAACRRR
jgi:hypothetical protein